MNKNLKYLKGYSPVIQQEVTQLIEDDRLKTILLKKYQSTHEIRSDKMLFSYVSELKNDYMRRAATVNRASFDNKLKVIQHALGTHTRISRVQGSKLKSKREIRVASLFKKCHCPFSE